MDQLKANSIILEKRKIAEKTTEISFKRPKNYEFEAGQYAQVIIPNLIYSDQKGNSRVFSIASSPNDRERIVIAFRDSDSGYKRTLIEAETGYEVIIRGPFGKDFSLPQDKNKKVIFIAGGIGITPFLSMIRFATERKLSLPITLFYANRTRKSSAYLEEIELLAKRNPYFEIKNKFGKMNKDFIKKNVKDVFQSEWFIAGPPAMVEDVSAMILSFGVSQFSLHKERFTGYSYN
jgi:ferredoxin-NADP reductase